MISIDEFCSKHRACGAGAGWAVANCSTMEDVWREAKGQWLVWVATRPGVAPARELRLLAVRAARSSICPTDHSQLFAAIDCAERHANGAATDEELAAARSVAYDVAYDDEGNEAYDGAYNAVLAVTAADACTAAWAAAKGAVLDAALAHVESCDSTRRAEWSAAWAAGRDAAWDGLASWCRENMTPNFD